MVHYEGWWSFSVVVSVVMVMVSVVVVSVVVVSVVVVVVVVRVPASCGEEAGGVTQWCALEKICKEPEGARRLF